MGKICQRSTMRVSVASALLCACACNAFVPGRAPRVRVISPLLAKKDKGGGDDAVAEVQASLDTSARAPPSLPHYCRRRRLSSPPSVPFFRRDVRQRLSEGTICEFSEKGGKTFVGVIKSSESKSKGGARYELADETGALHSIAEKQLTFVGKVVEPKNIAKTLGEFADTLHANSKNLCNQLGIDAELFMLAWETAAEEEEGDLYVDGFFQHMLSRKTNSLEERYKAWRLLTSDVGHLFFKELKTNGRVDHWKAKTVKAVDAAKQQFCASHDEPEFCFV